MDERATLHANRDRLVARDCSFVQFKLALYYPTLRKGNDTCLDLTIGRPWPREMDCHERFQSFWVLTEGERRVQERPTRLAAAIERVHFGEMMRILLRPLHRWIWLDTARRARKLLRFAETEADGGRDLVRAAEITADPLLRRLFLFHARDEQRHAQLFHQRGASLLRGLAAPSRSGYRADWLAPGERGLDDLRVEHMEGGALLAFLHLSEKSAATDFASYRDVLQRDPPTRAIFEEVLRDEAYHMNYTLSQLVRVSPRHRRLLWRARFSRLWKGYLRLAIALAGLISGLILTFLYFTLLVPFAFLAKRAARQEPPGWSPISSERSASLDRQY